MVECVGKCVVFRMSCGDVFVIELCMMGLMLLVDLFNFEYLWFVLKFVGNDFLVL